MLPSPQPVSAPDREDRESDCRQPRERGEVFPHCVCRTAGLPVASVESLAAPAAADLLDEVAEVEREMACLGEALAEPLYAAVGEARDGRRGDLLRIRRDVHNLRPVEAGRAAAVGAHLAPRAAAAVARYAELAARRQRCEEALPGLYDRELTAHRRTFQAAVSDDDFRRALLLSSRSLAAGVERYQAAPPAALGAKERQIERGLLRYFTRMAMKTSPFGTFTAIVAGRLVDGADDGRGQPRLNGDPGAKRSLVRLNKRIYGVLRGVLLADGAARRHLEIELNPTLHRDGEGWRYLAATGGGEVFQRLAGNAVLDVYQELLGAAPRRLRDLEEAVAGHPAVEAAAEQVTDYTERLLEVGFLRFRFGIPPQEAEWDEPLARLLAGLPGETAAGVAELLETLRRRRAAFPGASLAERARLLDEAAEAMAAFSPDLTRRTGMRTDVPFYEDAGASARLLLPAGDLAPALESLVHYVRLTSRIAWPRHELASMRHFFDTYYGRGAVPLLTFYEDYYREHFKEHLERVAAVAGGSQPGEDGEEEEAGEKEEAGGSAAWYDGANPFGLEMVVSMRRGQEEMVRLLRRRWRRRPDAESIDLSREELEAAVSAVPPVAAERFSSSLFTQVLPGFAADGGPALLVSSLLRGFGKYFSRFLEVLPGEVRDDLLRANSAAGGARLAEIRADGDFNGNLHPPLVPWEVDYPTAESGTEAARLAVTHLWVEAHPRDPHALRLSDGAGGHPVVPLDLGFLNPLWRPPLFQLLANLAPAASFYMQLPDVPWAAAGPVPEEEGAPRVVHRPRIVYDGRLVVARRRWVVPPELFPRRRSGEGDADYFLRADRWRREHGIPRQVFVSFHRPPGAPRPVPAEGGGDRPPRRGDRHKPQFVDFASPLLVDLFGRLVAGGVEDHRIHLYERLPDRDHLAVCGDRRYVTELVLQVDFPDGLGAPAGRDRDG